MLGSHHLTIVFVGYIICLIRNAANGGLSRWWWIDAELSRTGEMKDGLLGKSNIQTACNILPFSCVRCLQEWRNGKYYAILNAIGKERLSWWETRAFWPVWATSNGRTMQSISFWWSTAVIPRTHNHWGLCPSPQSNFRIGNLHPPSIPLRNSKRTQLLTNYTRLNNFYRVSACGCSGPLPLPR